MSTTESEAPISRHRLLVVDDEPAVLKLVATILSKHGHEIATSASGADAYEQLKKETFDCVVTDAIMPEVSGYDLVKLIRNHPGMAEMPVVMLTRKRHREDVKLAVEAGVTDYVLKPIDEHLLADKVESALKKGQGKRQVFESTINGEQAAAEIGFDCRVTAVSEADITLRLPMQLHSGVTFNF
ncbi:MAG: response regulator, partial [Bdellovibrionota bacterium]